MLRMTKENQARAAAASQAIEFYYTAKNGSADQLSQSMKEALIDLLSDLRHFADAAGLDFDAADRLAQDHYEVESW